MKKSRSPSPRRRVSASPRPSASPSPRGRVPASPHRSLRARLAEAEETLRAIRGGEVDALVVSRPGGDQVFTLQGADTTYRFLVEEMNEGALLLEPGGTVLYANARFAEMAGVVLEAVSGGPWDRLFVAEAQAGLARLLRETKSGPARGDFVLSGAGGAKRPVSVSLCSMQRDGGQGLCAVITDLTERKAAEAALRTANDSLEARVRERTAEMQLLVGNLQAREMDLERQNEELRQIEEALNATRQEIERERTRYAELFEHAPDAYLVTGLGGHIREVNRAGCRLLKQERGFLLKLPLVRFVAQEDKQIFLSLLSGWQQGAAAESRSVEVRLGSAKEAPIACALTVNAVQGKAGGVSGLRWIVRDMTQQKQAEEALAASRNQIQGIIDGTPALIYAFDLEERFVLANTTLAEFLNSTPEQMMGKRRQEFMPGKEAEWHEANDRHVLESGTALEFEEHNQLKGRSITWLTTKFPLRDAQGQIYGVAGISADITARKRAEDVVRESEERYRTLFETIDEGFCTIELLFDESQKAVDYRFLTVNPSFERQTGIRDAVGRRMREIAPMHEEHWFRIYGQVALSGEPTRFEHAAEQLGRYFEVYAFRIGPPAAHTVAILFNDISVRKQADAVLKRDKEELERLVAERTSKLHELVEELEHFSYTITHDLKSPLRAMRSFAKVILTEMCGECDRVEARDFLERISTSAERMDHLIDDALSYSRSVRQELPLEDVDAGALLRGMLDSYPEFEPDKARIRVEGRLPVVLANKAGLTQCFSNLLGNAVKFVKPGEVPEIRVRAEALHPQPSTLNSQPQQWVRIWVEDNGIGIGKQMLPRVFDMFARASKDYEGTGIGLALVRKVAQRMGGRVGVESEEGQGSRFWIELKSGEGEALSTGATARRAEPPGSGEGTVLYVEDEESDAMFMQRAFAGKGLSERLRLVGDGQAAINYLSGSGEYNDRVKYPMPALVLLDLNLPYVPGFEVLQWMRNHPDFAKTPVVVFSSSTRDDDRVKAQRLGANEFVSKPSSAARFGEVVEGLRGKWMGLSL